MNKQLKNTILIFIALLLAGCGKSEGFLETKNDLEGAYIAILGNAVSDKDFEKQFPQANVEHFKSSSEFLLALSIGKCDAGLVERGMGGTLLEKRGDFASLPYAETDSTIVIAHCSMLPDGDDMAQGGGLFHRMNRSIVDNGYWRLILKGLGATVVMFIMGIIFAFVLAILMQWMNTRKYLRYVSRPISYFIKTIHDVPSVVLIFFFYYFVFASVHISGILVCSISLGVYTSGSLMNIFNVHLKQIDKNQHLAAQMLGLTGWKKYRYVILPQAVKPMLPFICGETKVLLRATSYAGYISELDLVKVSEIIRNQTYDVLVPLLLVSVVFLLLSHLIVNGLSAIYKKAFKV